MIDKEELARLTMPGHISSEKLLSFLEECDIISADDVRSVEIMNKKTAVLEKHNHAIAQGTGKDKRWFSRVDDPLTKRARRIAASTEEALYNKLYDHYFVQPLYSKTAGKTSTTRKKPYAEMTGPFTSVRCFQYRTGMWFFLQRGFVRSLIAIWSK